MYSVAVRRDFAASHYLIGGDWGPESKLHSHDYSVELSLQGKKLDEHGYLVDILVIEEQFDRLVENFGNKTLNELPEFSGLNPSIEHFARILCESLAAGIRTDHLTMMTVRVWENPLASATYMLEF